MNGNDATWSSYIGFYDQHPLSFRFDPGPGVPFQICAGWCKAVPESDLVVESLGCIPALITLLT